jgi:hypothetical protein
VSSSDLMPPTTVTTVFVFTKYYVFPGLYPTFFWREWIYENLLTCSDCMADYGRILCYVKCVWKCNFFSWYVSLCLFLNWITSQGCDRNCSFLKKGLPNVRMWWLAYLICIPVVPCSNVDAERRCEKRRGRGLYLHGSSRQMLECYIKIGHIRV